MRKKLRSLLMLPLLIMSVLSVLSINVVEVSGVKSPFIGFTPWNIVNPASTPGTVFNWTLSTNYTGSDIWGYEFDLTYNPVVLEVLEVHNGGLIVNDTTTRARFLPGTPDNEAGELSVTSAYFYFEKGETPDVTGGPGPHVLAIVEFNVTGTGDSDVILGDETKLIRADGSGNTYTVIDYSIPAKGHLDHGYFANTDPIHDVAVASVSCSKHLVYSGETVTITVGVSNNGNVTEKFDVTVYYTATPIETQTKTLAPGSDTLTFTWDTTPARGNHTISAVASNVGSTMDAELDLDNNMGTDPTNVIVKAPVLAVEPDYIFNMSLTGGSTFQINITITDAYELYTAAFNLTYNHVVTLLDCISVSQGDFFDGVANAFIYVKGSDYVYINYTCTGAIPGVTGSGLLATLTFQVLTKGGSYLTLEPPYLTWWTETWVTTPVLIDGVVMNTLDVSVWYVSSAENRMYPTWDDPLEIKVGVKNLGFVSVGIYVAVFYNDTLIENRSTSMMGRQFGWQSRRDMVFFWDLSSVPWGLYEITARVYYDDDLVPDNNNYTLGDFKVKIPGDIDCDTKVDKYDFGDFAGAYGSKTGEPRYLPEADLNNDGDVDKFDFGTFAGNYGKTTTAYPPD